ncbi:MAG TPA: hypothetical protein V6D08_19780, partial [Candidatus Obscuribacterales bacterium]
GETLTDIARAHLGRGASHEQVQKHVCEIARLNALVDQHSLPVGHEIELPGYTKDGGYVIRDSAGNRVTTWADGTLRLQRPDQRGYVRRSENDGSYSEEHWGKRPQDNFQITRTADGRIFVTDKKGDVPHGWLESDNVALERRRLLELIEDKVDDSQHRAKFIADMARFEQRAQKQGIKPDDVARTYYEISRLLDAAGDKPLTSRQRIAVAEQVMSQAANPGSIDQGVYGTCNVASVEVRTYTRDPVAAARLVADVAITGKYEAADETEVKIRAESIKPYSGAESNPPEDGTRSHASQIFQVTAANLGHARKNPHYEYVLQAPTPSDNGERLYDRSRGRDDEEVTETCKPVRSPNLSEDQLVELTNLITGKQEKDFVIVHDGYRSSDNILRIKSEQELSEALALAVRNGRLPVIVRVDAGNQPFFRDSDGGTAGGSDGAHVVTVTGYDQGPPARVTIDNTWGSKSDHPGGSEISLHDLYLSMREAGDKDRLKELRHDVKWDRSRNQADAAKLFDLRRQEYEATLARLNEAEEELQCATKKRAAGEITQAELTHASRQHEDAKRQHGEAAEKHYRLLLQDARDIMKRWSEEIAQGRVDADEMARGVAMMLLMVKSLPLELRLGALKEYKSLGAISDKQFDQATREALQAAEDEATEAR